MKNVKLKIENGAEKSQVQSPSSKVQSRNKDGDGALGRFHAGNSNWRERLTDQADVEGGLIRAS